VVYEQEKLVRLAMLYPKDFTALELEYRKSQLEHDIQNDTAINDNY
jgi:hypothetical protein